jgi:hypothetical protein
MDAPKCRICGKGHWSPVCDGNDDVTKRVTPVTKPVAVTPGVTVCPHCLTLAAEVERLRAELVRVVKLPMTSAERVRKLRAKRKFVQSEKSAT